MCNVKSCVLSYCPFGVKPSLSLGQRLMYVNPLVMTPKVVGVIEMTYLYDAWYSFVLLRPTKEVKLLTQSAEK